MIQYKSKSEIEMIRRSGQIIARVFEELEDIIKPGVSTLEINNLAQSLIWDAGATPSFLNYGEPPFPGAICASINDEVVHGIPSRKRILREGDIISIDLGALLDGYHSDAARTYPVGRISPETQKLIDVTEECFWLGFKMVQIGNRLGDISSAIEDHASANGYGIVRELTGHGIGKQLHEDPDVPNYGKAGRGLRIEDGLVIAIEPMINMGTRNVRIKKDEWTIVTQDGKPSAHYENTVAATPDGPVILTMLQ
ncbi:MAG: type I methionyl aminopeptidase [Saccharofermentanales bacterium]